MHKEQLLGLIGQTGIYLVTEDAVPPEQRLRAVSEALEAGAKVIQLRDKTSSKRRLLEEARAIRLLCSRHEALFIVNDDVSVAVLSDAGGVHVGQDDLPLADVRRLVGASKLIGVSISAVGEAVEADRQGADYLGVGAIYATPTKLDAELGGLSLLREVRLTTSRPLVAIGGIAADNAAECFAAGADAVAVVRAAFAQPDVRAAVGRLLEVARMAKSGGREGA